MDTPTHFTAKLQNSGCRTSKLSYMAWQKPKLTYRYRIGSNSISGGETDGCWKPFSCNLISTMFRLQQSMQIAHLPLKMTQFEIFFKLS